MNYYPFHIGDYLSATRHLSWEEDAAYRRMLDTYYTTEKPLPLDVRAVCRLVLATTDSQREAVEVVLGEFFERTDAGWVNHRADGEILAMQEKQQKQRDKALECLEVYAPIAHRLGMRKVKEYMEDISLKYLDPVAYKEIEDNLK